MSLRDQHARLLAAREPRHRLIELLSRKQKTRRPRRDMNHAVLIDDRIAVRRKRTAQRLITVQLPVLLEVNDPQLIRALESPASGSSSPVSSRSSVVLPLPFGPTRPTRIPAVSAKFRPVEQRLALRPSSSSLQARPAASSGDRSAEIDPRAVRLRLLTSGKLARSAHWHCRCGPLISSSGLRSAAQPFLFDAYAILQRFLPPCLRVEKLFLRLQKWL